MTYEKFIKLPEGTKIKIKKDVYNIDIGEIHYENDSLFILNNIIDGVACKNKKEYKYSYIIYGVDDYKKLGGDSIDIIGFNTDIQYADIGDIITDGRYYRRVLDFLGENFIMVSGCYSCVDDIESLDELLEDDDSCQFAIKLLKKEGYKIHREEEEIEELTVEEICKELGRNIKIIK